MAFRTRAAQWCSGRSTRYGCGCLQAALNALIRNIMFQLLIEGDRHAGALRWIGMSSNPWRSITTAIHSYLNDGADEIWARRVTSTN